MFEHAPRVLNLGGRRAVPMHIVGLTARVTIDPLHARADAEATMTYDVGPWQGFPMFDLRQQIDEAWLDGRALAVSALAPTTTGEGEHASIRLIHSAHRASSRHTLRLRYRLATPLSDLGGAYPPLLQLTGDGRVRWSIGMGDLFDGRHLEMWFPANLPFDQFPFALKVRLARCSVEHSLVTNGMATPLGWNHWSVDFPAWFSGMCHLIELRPSGDLERARADVRLRGSGRSIAVEAWKPRQLPGDPEVVTTRAAQLLTTYERRFGPYQNAVFTCFLHGAAGGMEYAGATTTSLEALEHEVVHSWFARGVLPASHADGWWDEAYTTYLTGGGAKAERLDFRRPPVQLCSRRPLQRHTHPAAYTAGSRLFRGLADIVGPDRLERAMQSLFRRAARTTVSTAMLEEHLVLETSDPRLVDAFHRFVYGFDDPSAPMRLSVDRVWSGRSPTPGARLHALISNRSAQACRHFLVVFAFARPRTPSSERSPLSAQSSRPILRNVAAVCGFDLGPGEQRELRVELGRQDLIGVTAGGPTVVCSAHARGAGADLLVRGAPALTP